MEHINNIVEYVYDKYSIYFYDLKKEEIEEAVRVYKKSKFYKGYFHIVEADIIRDILLHIKGCCYPEIYEWQFVIDHIFYNIKKKKNNIKKKC